MGAIGGEAAGDAEAVLVGFTDTLRRDAVDQRNGAGTGLGGVLPAVGQVELARQVGDRRRVERESCRRRGQGDGEPLRVIERDRGGDRRHGGVLGKRPAAGDEVDRYGVAAGVVGEAAGGPVAELDVVAVLLDEHRRLAAVELDGAEPGAAQGELRRAIGHRSAIEREAGRGVERPGDIDIATPAQSADVDLAAGARRKQAHGRALDEKDARRGQVAGVDIGHGGVAAGIAPAFAIVGRAVGLERDVDFTRRKIGLGGAIAELTHPLLRKHQDQVRVFVGGAVAVVVPVFGVHRAVTVPVTFEPGAVGVGNVNLIVGGKAGIINDQRQGRGPAVGHGQADGREFEPRIENRGVVERGAGGGLEYDVDIGIAGRLVGHVDIHGRPGSGERGRHFRHRVDQREREGLAGGAQGAGGVAPRGRFGYRQRQDAGLEVRVVLVEEQAHLALAQRYPGLGVGAGADGDAADFVAPAAAVEHRAAGGEALQRGVVDLAGGRGHQAHIDVRHHQQLDAEGIGRLALPDTVRIQRRAAMENLDAVGVGVGEGLFEPDDVHVAGGALVAVDPVPPLAVHQQRRLGVVKRDRAARAELEFRRQVGHAGEIERLACRAGRNGHHQIAAAGQGGAADDTTIVRADQAHIGLPGLRIDHREHGFLAGVRVAEAHLEAAVDGEQLHLVGNIGQEQDGGLAGGDLRQIGIQPPGDGQIVGGEVELADDQDLAIGGDAQNDLAVEHFLGGVDGEELGAAGDQHRRGKGGGETVLRRVGLNRAVLLDHL